MDPTTLPGGIPIQGADVYRPEGGIYSVVSSLEMVMDSLGMMRGSFAIPKRFAFGTILTAFLITYLKPSYLYNGEEPKEWVVISNRPDSIVLPWWLLSTFGGLALAVFI